MESPPVVPGTVFRYFLVFPFQIIVFTVSVYLCEIVAWLEDKGSEVAGNTNSYQDSLVSLKWRKKYLQGLNIRFKSVFTSLETFNYKMYMHVHMHAHAHPHAHAHKCMHTIQLLLGSAYGSMLSGEWINEKMIMIHVLSPIVLCLQHALLVCTWCIYI